MRALILKYIPLPFAIAPHHEIHAQELRRVRLGRIDHVDRRHWVPLFRPAKRLGRGGDDGGAVVREPDRRRAGGVVIHTRDWGGARGGGAAAAARSRGRCG